MPFPHTCTSTRYIYICRSDNCVLRQRLKIAIDKKTILRLNEATYGLWHFRYLIARLTFLMLDIIILKIKWPGIGKKVLLPSACLHLANRLLFQPIMVTYWLSVEYWSSETNLAIGMCVVGGVVLTYIVVLTALPLEETLVGLLCLAWSIALFSHVQPSILLMD